MTNTIKKNYGLVTPEILPEDYIFGASQLPTIVLQDNGQWPDLLVPHEQQNLSDVETSNCVSFGSTTAWEMIIKQEYKDERNFSDRALGIMAGTRPPGNTPNKVAYTAHKKGLIEEKYLPFDSTIIYLSDYYSPDPLPQPLLDRGLQLLTQYEIGYEWVFSGGSLQEKQERMMDTLRYSPLGMAVHAWKEENGLYKQESSPNHWTTGIGYVKNLYWIIKDSYPPFIKRVPWNTDFAFIMRYSITKNPVIQKKNNLLQLLVRYFEEIMK